MNRVAGMLAVRGLTTRTVARILTMVAVIAWPQMGEKILEHIVLGAVCVWIGFHMGERHEEHGKSRRHQRSRA